jgi:hypothetical protein
MHSYHGCFDLLCKTMSTLITQLAAWPASRCNWACMACRSPVTPTHTLLRPNFLGVACCARSNIVAAINLGGRVYAPDSFMTTMHMQQQDKVCTPALTCASGMY